MQKYRILALIILAVLNTSAFAAMKTSTITFEGVPGNTVVDSNGMTWTIVATSYSTSTTISTSYDANYGACWHKAQSVRLTSPSIKGKIHRVTVNASMWNNTAINPQLSVDYATYNKKAPTDTPEDYTFDLYAEIDGTFNIEISSGVEAQRISIKSVELVYDEGASPASETQYEQVTNVDQLKHGDEIIITTDLGNNKYRAMGLSRGNERSINDITWTEDKTFTGSFKSSPILLEQSGNYWHLRATEGYLYDGSSGNSKRLKAGSLDEAGNNADISFTFDTNGKAILSFPRHTTTSYKYLYLIDTSSPIVFNCSANKSSLCIFRKIKQEAATIDVTFNQELGGWTSVYYQDKNLVVPEAFTAYAFTVTDGKGTTSTPYTTGDVIPKNTAVLLKLNDGYDEFDANGNKMVTVQTTDSEGKQPEDNMLLGSKEGGTTSPPPSGNSEDYEFFRLTLNADSDPESIGFYRGEADGGPFTVGAHEAYLALPKSQSSLLTYIPLRVIPFLLGDANGDGHVSVSDVMIVVNYILGNNPKIIKLDRSDVNFDGKINVSDVMGIVHIILGSAN